jgi:hypothetical protein
MSPSDEERFGLARDKLREFVTFCVDEASDILNKAAKAKPKIIKPRVDTSLDGATLLLQHALNVLQSDALAVGFAEIINRQVQSAGLPLQSTPQAPQMWRPHEGETGADSTLEQKDSDAGGFDDAAERALLAQMTGIMLTDTSSDPRALALAADQLMASWERERRGFLSLVLSGLARAEIQAGNMHFAQRLLDTAIDWQLSRGGSVDSHISLLLNLCAALSTAGDHRRAFKTAIKAMDLASTKLAEGRHEGVSVSTTYLCAVARFNAAVEAEHLRDKATAVEHYTVAKDRAIVLISEYTGSLTGEMMAHLRMVYTTASEALGTLRRPGRDITLQIPPSPPKASPRLTLPSLPQSPARGPIAVKSRPSSASKTRVPSSRVTSPPASRRVTRIAPKSAAGIVLTSPRSPAPLLQPVQIRGDQWFVPPARPIVVTHFSEVTLAEKYSSSPPRTITSPSQLIALQDRTVRAYTIRPSSANAATSSRGRLESPSMNEGRASPRMDMRSLSPPSRRPRPSSASAVR